MSQARTKQGSITFIMSRKAFALGLKRGRTVTREAQRAFVEAAR